MTHIIQTLYLLLNVSNIAVVRVEGNMQIYIAFELPKINHNAWFILQDPSQVGNKYCEYIYISVQKHKSYKDLNPN